MSELRSVELDWFKFDGTVPNMARDYYEHNGFAVFRNVFTGEELNIIRGDQKFLEQRTLSGEIPDHMRDLVLPPSIDEDGNKRLHRLPYFTHYGESTKKLIDEKKIGTLAESLLGSGAWLLQDTMHGSILQEKRGGNTNFSAIHWHLDFPKEHILSPLMNVGIYLNDSTIENGCLVIVPGSHRYPNGRHDAEPVPVEVKAGDVVFHTYNIFHASGPIVPGNIRATLYLYYSRGEHPGKWIPFYTDKSSKDINSLYSGSGKE